MFKFRDIFLGLVSSHKFCSEQKEKFAVRNRTGMHFLLGICMRPEYLENVLVQTREGLDEMRMVPREIGSLTNS